MRGDGGRQVATVSVPALHPGRDYELLSEVVVELEASRAACLLTDAELTMRWVSSELLAALGVDDSEALGYGRHLIDALLLPAWSSQITRPSLEAMSRRIITHAAAHAEMTGSPRTEEFRAMCRELGITAQIPPSFWTDVFDVREEDGSLYPSRYLTALLGHPTAGFIGCATIIGTQLRARLSELLTRGDEAMYERIADLSTPRREPAAMLFADLENSAGLSRSLSTAAYFDLVCRLLTRVDRAIAGRCGIVGKHAGDGGTGFFRVADTGSPSAAARAAIETARDITAAARELKTGSPDGAVALNVGIHYAPAVYLGQLITSGRLEVTALGDDVTVTARMQQSAQGGQLLASKSLIEQLSPDDAKALDIDPVAATYTPLDRWPTATEKARRDAPGLPVCALPTD